MKNRETIKLKGSVVRKKDGRKGTSRIEGEEGG